MPASALDPALLRAYQATEYRVLAQPPFTLTIGAHSPALRALQAAQRAAGSAFLTACNPRSVRFDAEENARRQAALAADLLETGYVFLPGQGVAPAGDWPGEPSFLVLGIGPAAARDLARQYDQNALLWSAEDAVPQLVLLR